MISNFKINIFDVGRKYFTEHFFGKVFYFSDLLVIKWQSVQNYFLMSEYLRAANNDDGGAAGGEWPALRSLDLGLDLSP
jgi:hypothetical protein